MMIFQKSKSSKGIRHELFNRSSMVLCIGRCCPLPSSEIIAAIKERGYREYREAEILGIDSKAEPSRTYLLREIRQEVCQQLQKDGRRYWQAFRGVDDRVFNIPCRLYGGKS